VPPIIGEVAASARELAKRDLYFLARTVLGRVYPDLTEKTHRPICDFFVKKDPERAFLRQDTIKNRLLLYPRGHFKSSINICDCIQWMLCFPDVTMQLLGGTEELTERFVWEMKEHFLSNGDFRNLFPEFLPDGDTLGIKGEFTLPNRRKIRREPTMSVSTLQSAKASSHFDIQKGDDTVNEQNSKTAEMNQKIAKDWSHTKPLLNPGGYRELIGTLYDYSCHYGPIIDRYREGKLPGWKVLVAPSITPNPATGELWHENGILFPERFCIDSNLHPDKENLQQIWRDDPELFYAQYQNEPIGKEANQFPISVLKEHVISRQQVPSSANMVATWYLAFAKNRKTDFSVCALGAFDPNGNLYVIDLIRGRYTPAEIIQQLILSWRKWPVQRVGLAKKESTVLGPGLYARQLEQRISIPIDQMKDFSGDDQSNQIVSLSPLLEQHKLWFVSSCSYLQEAFMEFSRFPKYAMDDIPRAISRLLYYRAMGFRPDASQQPTEVVIGGAMTYGDGECGAGIVA